MQVKRDAAASFLNLAAEEAAEERDREAAERAAAEQELGSLGDVSGSFGDADAAGGGAGLVGMGIGGGASGVGSGGGGGGAKARVRTDQMGPLEAAERAALMFENDVLAQVRGGARARVKVRVRVRVCLSGAW